MLTKGSAEVKIKSSLENLESKNNDKQQTVLVVVNIDIDGLKGINDKYGHLAGDIALKFFGTKLNDALRPGPNTGGIHYSGDEFGIVLEMTYDANLSQQEVDKFIQKRISSIVAQACAPVISRGAKSHEARMQEEETILHLYNKTSDISDLEKQKVLDQHQIILGKITQGTRQQQVSTGYIITRAEDNATYVEIQEKADKAEQVSKLLPYLELVKAINDETPYQDNFSSSDRAINIKDLDYIYDKYNEEEIIKARLVRSLSRTTKELAPGLTEIVRVRLILSSPELLAMFVDEENNDPEQQNLIWEEMKEREERSKALREKLKKLKKIQKIWMS